MEADILFSRLEMVCNHGLWEPDSSLLEPDPGVACAVFHLAEEKL